ECANNTEYIETVPKRGYRFVVEVSQIDGRMQAAAPPHPPQQGQHVPERQPTPESQPTSRAPLLRKPWARLVAVLAPAGLGLAALVAILARAAAMPGP